LLCINPLFSSLPDLEKRWEFQGQGLSFQGFSPEPTGTLGFLPQGRERFGQLLNFSIEKGLVQDQVIVGEPGA